MPTDSVAAETDALRAEVARLRAENLALKARQDELELSDARFRRLLESQIIGVLIGSAQGKILAINEAFERMIGRSSAQLDELEWQTCVPPEAAELHQEKAGLLWKTGACPAWETAFVRPDGARVPVLTGATLVGGALDSATPDATSDASAGREIEGEAPTMLMWAIDITERKRAEDELRDSESRMRAIVQNIHDGLLITDVNDNVTYANGRMSEMCGYSNAELVGQNARELLTLSADRQACRARNRERIAGLSGNYEIPILHKDGSLRWLLVNGSPLRDEAGVTTGTIGAHFDITERKRDETELALFTKRLENSNRDLETFAFAVSHDLKQPLRKIEVFGSRLESEEGDRLSPQGRIYVNRMGDASRRMTSLIDGLLAYSRVATGQTAWGEVDLGRVAREVLLDLELAIERAGATIEVGELPVVRADATQMRQLLQNLIGNALAYRRPDVPLVVRVAGDARAGRCEIEVADNGRGFAPELAESVFEIFRRLDNGKDEARETGSAGGAGVGLTICRAIVARHGGELSAQGAPGQGATFRATFPLSPPLAQGEPLEN